MLPSTLRPPTHDEWAAWSQASILLDGKPAVIRGRLQPFAKIFAIVDGCVAIDGPAFSWAAVRRIMAGSKSFTSGAKPHGKEKRSKARRRAR